MNMVKIGKNITNEYKCNYYKNIHKSSWKLKEFHIFGVQW